MKHWIIADSGGTSTTWVWGGTTELGRLETGSLHPRNIAAFSDEDKKRLIELNQQFRFDDVQFYGAGMSSAPNKEMMLNFLSELSFENSTVDTDALAAGLACCEFEHGFAAILGTGSILIEMDHGKMISRRGGLGPEKGDQGSAYYFGKLFLEAVRNGEYVNEVEELFGTTQHFLNDYDNSDASYLAGLAKLTSALNVKELHRKNVKAFIATHILVENTKPTEISVIGSYGYHISSILREELKAVDVLLNRVFTTPLDSLVQLKIKNIVG